jgi:hypothetical protein
VSMYKPVSIYVPRYEQLKRVFPKNRPKTAKNSQFRAEPARPTQ